MKNLSRSWMTSIQMQKFDGLKELGENKQGPKWKLTGGAENLKSEEPLKARNFGEYIRSWTESCSFSSTQPM